MNYLANETITYETKRTEKTKIRYNNHNYYEHVNTLKVVFSDFSSFKIVRTNYTARENIENIRYSNMSAKLRYC